jgi:LysM repeat protein
MGFDSRRLRCWGVALLGMIALGAANPCVAKKKSTGSDDDDAANQFKKPSESHVVKRGETLWGIARKYEVSVGELMDLNHMPNDKVHEGQVLKLPMPGESENVTGITAPAVHVVVKGETLRSIARANGITRDQLIHANPKLDPDNVKVGTKLKIPPHPVEGEEGSPKPHATDETTSAKYVVGEKDTFYSIAKAHGLTVSAVAKANPDVAPEKLHPGMKLVLPHATTKEKDKAASTREEKATDTADDEKPVQAKAHTHPYTVSRGETAQSIAEAFGISVKRLCELNSKKSAASFKEGSEILVPDQ